MKYVQYMYIHRCLMQTTKILIRLHNGSLIRAHKVWYVYDAAQVASKYVGTKVLTTKWVANSVFVYVCYTFILGVYSHTCNSVKMSDSLSGVSTSVKVSNYLKKCLSQFAIQHICFSVEKILDPVSLRT